ncbi:hypothetical protein CEXT_185091 [Caerostris extrusa]|uniref:Uncharacterized protein n=1 Tax=Caerostris extrusa TaxID=172846 RepID=A0AAV4RY25_CAEEX|nr:hypothetical protein CEXT_185091 [Caerostris extrusa]
MVSGDSNNPPPQTRRNVYIHSQIYAAHPFHRSWRFFNAASLSDQHYPMPVTEPCSLPGFQQTSGRRSSLMNQIAQYPNASSEMDCSLC